MRLSTFLATVGVLAGLVGGFLLAFTIYLQTNQSPGCDIPCDADDTVVYVGALIGGVVGGGIGWIAGSWLERRT